MKKRICMILVLIMALSLCACGQDKTNSTTNNDATEDNSTSTTETPTTENAQSAAPTALSEFTFTVYGKEFHLGMKMSDLLATGVFTNCEYRDESLEPIANGTALVNLGTEKKCTLYIHLWNLSRDTIDVQDATVVGVSYIPEYWDASAKSNMGDVCFRGAKLNSSIEDITDIFGKPNVHEDTFDGDEYRGGGWRGFDIGSDFRMNLSIEHLKSLPEEESMSSFDLQFKPYTDNIS